MASENEFKDDFNEIDDCTVRPSNDETTLVNKTTSS